MQYLRSARSYTKKESSYAHAEFLEKFYVLITGVLGENLKDKSDMSENIK